MQSAEKQLGVHLPILLHHALESRALVHRRTLNAEILACLEDSLKQQDDADSPDAPLDSLLDDAMNTAVNVSSSIGLLGDMFGEIGVARRDADIARLARALDVIRREAEKVEGLLSEASKRCSSAPAEALSTSIAPHRPRIVRDLQ